MNWLETHEGKSFADYDALWEWSTTDLPAFWDAVWRYFDVVGTRSSLPVLTGPEMPDVHWFPGCTINYVRQIFCHACDDRPAVIFSDETGAWAELSYAELRRQTAALADTLRSLGVGKGDCVAAYLGNTPQAVVGFLAAASLGAIWTMCAPEMGAQAVLERLRQVEPKVLIATEEYRWAGKVHDRRSVVHAMLGDMPSLTACILTSDLSKAHAVDVKLISWAEASVGDHVLAIEEVEFEHPLWILYSSGTTGPPKAIVHGHGGIVLEHLKWLALHFDLREGDRYFWYSSSGWMVWNAAVSGLLLGTTICLYDGNPNWPDSSALWKFAEACKASFFGSGASYFAHLQKTGFCPRDFADTSSIRSVTAAGSPVSAEAFPWFYEQIWPDLFFCPASGGTDIASAFVGSVPILPVYAGEMQAACLGARVAAFSEDGVSLIDEVGELVCTRPMPSMPLYFWGDQEKKRYRSSYFERFPAVWTHGDWLRITKRNGAIIYGRSDATINRKGVRAGTSEYYRVLENLPEITDSIVVDLQVLDHAELLIAFVVLRTGNTLTPTLQAKIKAAIREAISPRHVPDAIVAAPAVPTTLTGKRLEIPVKKILLGLPVAEVANPSGLANPASLDWYVRFAREWLTKDKGIRGAGDRATTPIGEIYDRP